LFGEDLWTSPRAFGRFGSLIGRFSPKLCTTAVQYRGPRANIFGHLCGANFEVLSLPQVIGHKKVISDYATVATRARAEAADPAACPGLPLDLQVTLAPHARQYAHDKRIIRFASLTSLWRGSIWPSSDSAGLILRQPADLRIIRRDPAFGGGRRVCLGRDP